MISGIYVAGIALSAAERGSLPRSPPEGAADTPGGVRGLSVTPAVPGRLYSAETAEIADMGPAGFVGNTALLAFLGPRASPLRRGPFGAMGDGESSTLSAFSFLLSGSESTHRTCVGCSTRSFGLSQRLGCSTLLSWSESTHTIHSASISCASPTTNHITYVVTYRSSHAHHVELIRD